jgi:hypothetical protein
MRIVAVRSEEEAYRDIANGNLIYGDRGIGKTRALLRVIHDKHNGNVIVLFPRREFARYAICMYRQMFPGELLFKTMTFWNCVNHGMDGISLPVYVDGLDFASPGDRKYIDDMVLAIRCLTGQGLAGCF